MTGYETVPRSRSPLIDALFRAAVLTDRTAALVKQQEQQYCCRLFLKIGGFKEVLRFRPLIEVQIPRRNPFIPI